MTKQSYKNFSIDFNFTGRDSIYATEFGKKYKMRKFFIEFDDANDFYKAEYIYKVLTKRELKWI